MLPATMRLFLLILGSYLLGAVPCGLLLGLARGVDLRQLGSGNIGATNAGRALGRGLGLLVFVLDFAKGGIPVAVGRWWLGPGEAPIGAGVAAVLGHVFPVYLSFRGGKGVATAAGAFTLLVPWATLAALVTWVVVLKTTRLVALASLVAAWSLPVFVLFLDHGRAAGRPELVGLGGLLALLITWRHRSNIRRLLKGEEPRIRETPRPSDGGGAP